MLCAQRMAPSTRNERSGTLCHPVFNHQHAQAKRGERFRAAAQRTTQGFLLQTPSTPFLLLSQLVIIILTAESLASQEKVPKSLLS